MKALQQAQTGGAKASLQSVAVVICSRSDERRLQLRAALTSVLEQDRNPDEVIAVIDHNDDLEAYAAENCPDVRTMPNQGPPGLSAARNTGIRNARSDIVAFLDDDAVAGPQWLSGILHHYRDSDVIGVGGRIVPVWPQGRPAWFPEEFDWVVGCGYRGMTERTQPVRNLIGCNMSFRRWLFDQLGGFSEGLGRQGNNGSGCEETEFCIRAGRAFPQGKILYDPTLVVFHHVAPERSTWRYFRTRCLAEGRSKARVVGRVGAADGLSSERSYAIRVLPRGVVRGIRDAVRYGNPRELAKSAAIASGLVLVTSAYLHARYRRRQREPMEDFAPILIVDLDLDRPTPPIKNRDISGRLYGGLFCLVRHNGRPITTFEIPLGRDGRPSLADDEASLPARLDALRRAAFRHAPIPATVKATEGPPIGVVVATRDRPTSLARCLDSLLRQTYQRFEIVVVDNAPRSAETADLVSSRYVSSGRVCYLRENRPGLGNAHNRGVATLTKPIVAFTDDDVVADPGWLAAIASGFSRGVNVGCVTGLILPAELSTRAQYWIEHHGGFGKGFETRLYDLDGNRPRNKLFPYAAGMLGSGANMAFTATALERIGGFDPALGAGTPARGGDDLAAFASVIRAGYQLVYEPAALIWHYHRRDEDAVRRQAFGYGIGLGAYLTRLVIVDPAALMDLAKAFPAALLHLFGPSSPKNRRLDDDYPHSLIWLERLGILLGFPAYLRSRASLHRAWTTRAAEPAAAGPQRRG